MMESVRVAITSSSVGKQIRVLLIEAMCRFPGKAALSFTITKSENLGKEGIWNER
jgi:hypothetical protein